MSGRADPSIHARSLRESFLSPTAERGPPIANVTLPYPDDERATDPEADGYLDRLRAGVGFLRGTFLVWLVGGFLTLAAYSLAVPALRELPAAAAIELHRG